MCCMWYFGELTKHLCLQLLCYVFQVLVMSAGRRRHDSYTHALEFMFEILGRCFVMITFDTMCFDIIL